MKNNYFEFDLEEFAKANMDLSERLFKEGVFIDYDEDADTLFLSIGEGAEAVSEHLVDGIYLRIDPSNLKIMGYTLLKFSSDILENNKLFKTLFQESFEQLKSRGGSVEWRGIQAKKVEPLFALAVR
jgi:uncharacterized protein YuzE